MANDETAPDRIAAIRDAVAKRQTGFMTELAKREKERLTEEWLSRIEKALEPGDFKALMHFIDEMESSMAKLEEAAKAKGTEDELHARIAILQKENKKMETELLGR